jgi:threonine dehydrogenase-like Zn-dependent dehydrogenase
MALVMGAHVVACGRNETTLEKLKESMPFSSLQTLRLESDEAKDTQALMKLLKGKPADVFIDFSPSAAGTDSKTPTHIATCIHVLKRGGVVSLMGGIRGKVDIPYMEVLFKNLVVRGKFMYEREQAQQVIKMMEKGFWKIGKVAGSKVILFELDQINDALDTAAQHPGWGTSVAVRL